MSHNMEDDDDDLYEPGDVSGDRSANEQRAPRDVSMGVVDGGEEEEEEEEVEEEEEDDDDDFNIIVDKPQEAVEEATPQLSRPSAIRSDSNRPASTDPGPTKTPTPALPSSTITITQQQVSSKTTDSSKPPLPGSAYPPYSASTIDVSANPIHLPTSKPILSLDLDADFPGENDKPWRRPGTDLSDYFNYGFDEFTWASYCLKQQDLRKEVKDQKKQMDEMQAFLAGGGLPGMPGPGPGPGPAPGNNNGGTPAPGPNPAMGMPELSPEMMNSVFAGMMAQGLDPSTMDPMTFMQHAQTMMGGQPSGGFGGQGQQIPFSGGGFDQNQGQPGGGGGFSGGRGRGGRRGGRNW